MKTPCRRMLYRLRATRFGALSINCLEKNTMYSNGSAAAEWRRCFSYAIGHMARCSPPRCCLNNWPADPAVVARFTEEARTAATLGGHPNIAEIFDVGEGGGLHYLIMPYVEGEGSSGCYLNRRGRPFEWRALEIVDQIANALIWAGDRNVVHQDLEAVRMCVSIGLGRPSCSTSESPRPVTFQSALTRTGESRRHPLLHVAGADPGRDVRCTKAICIRSGVIFFELPFGHETIHWRFAAGD